MQPRRAGGRQPARSLARRATIVHIGVSPDGGDVATPIPPEIPADRTAGVLDALEAILKKAAAHASGRDIDVQQVAVARLADVATKLRAARDLLAYAREAGGIDREQAAVFSGSLVSEVGSMVRDRGPEHGLGPGDAPAAELEAFGREALAEARVRAIGRTVAEQRGRNDGPLDELLQLARDAAREFAEKEIAPHAGETLCCRGCCPRDP